ncbi:MAG: hypothetical protein R2861_00725 [Desulfobacterales bacterium]
MEEVGGIACVATLIRQIREENDRKHVRTLVLGLAISFRAPPCPLSSEATPTSDASMPWELMP